MEERYTFEGGVLSIVHDTRRVKQGDVYPVKFRVTCLQKTVYYRTGYDLTEEEFARLPKAKNGDLKEHREIIIAGYDRIKGIIKALVKDGDFSLERLNSRLKGGKKNSVLDAFYAREEDLKKKGKLGTYDWYRYSRKALESFTGRDLKYSDITVEFLKQYEEHLLKKQEGQKKGKSYTSISMYMRALQAIVNVGKKEGYVPASRYPFGEGKYEIPETEGRRMALTLSQIGKVVNYPLLTENERRCRDLWYFMYLASGMNIIDLLHLKFNNIKNNIIYYDRIKTRSRRKKKKEIRVPVLPQMWEIIDQWGNPDKSPDNYIFMFINDEMTIEEDRRTVKNFTSLLNKKMRAIGKALGYGNLSSYVARHSYATVQKRADTSTAHISEALGHSTELTTQHYLDSFEDDEMLKNAEKLTQFEDDRPE